MRRVALLLIALFATFSLAFSFWRKTTIVERPQLAEMTSYAYFPDTGFSHLFDREANTLDGLIEKADAVALVRKAGLEEWKESSLLLELEVLRCFKGDLGGHIYYYEPISVYPRGEMLCVLGYVPMQEGREYLVILQKVKSPYEAEEYYYPLCADLGKHEKGKQATLFVGEATYGMVKDEPLALADESYMFFEGKDRMGLYNQIHDEIEQRGMFER